MTMDIFVDTYAATAAARRFAEHYNLGVVFDVDNNKPPWTDGKNIHLRTPLPNWSKEEMTHWWGMFIHETKHMTPRGRKCFKLADEEKLNMNTIHGLCLNLFEDSCINNIDKGKFIGMDETQAAHLTGSLETLLLSDEHREALWNKKELSQNEEIIGTSILLSTKSMESYIPSLIGMSQEVIDDPDCNPRIKELYEKASKNHLKALQREVDEVEDSDTRNVWDWMNNYLKDLWDIDPPPPPPPESEQNGNGKGESADGATKEAKEGAEEGEIDESEGEAIKGMLKEFLDNHDPDLNKRRSHRDMYYDPPNFATGSGHYTPPSADGFIVVNYKNKMFTDGTLSGRRPTSHRINFNDLDKASSSYRTYYEKAEVQDSLSNEIKRYIQSESRVKIHRNIKKGKLDAKKLFKLGVPDAGEDWKEKVFWEKAQKNMTKDTIVSVGGDFSGSMGNNKIIVQMHAMDLLSDVLCTLGVNHELWGFTVWGAYPTHFLFKQYGERVRRGELVDRMLSASNHMENNNDGDNILFAYNRMLQVRAKRRIMIVMSDGAPSGPGGDINWWTKNVIKKIEDQRLVEIHAIGILSESPKYFYKSYEIIKKTTELEPALLKVLKNKLIKVN